MPVDASLAFLRRAALLGAAVITVALAGPVLAADTPAAAADPAVAPALAADPKLEADAMELSHKLRCLVCQNQSIAESNAPLAVDLRDQVREQLAAGKSKDDVIEYLVDRYGDFVLYEPPFKAVTALLWLGPAALLLGARGGWLWSSALRAVCRWAMRCDCRCPGHGPPVVPAVPPAAPKGAA